MLLQPLILAVAIPCAALAEILPADLVVSTTNGPVRGFPANGGRVAKFLGYYGILFSIKEFDMQQHRSENSAGLHHSPPKHGLLSLMLPISRTRVPNCSQPTRIAYS